MADGGPAVRRADRLPAWAGELHAQLSAQRQELRRAKLELAGSQEVRGWLGRAGGHLWGGREGTDHACADCPVAPNNTQIHAMDDGCRSFRRPGRPPASTAPRPPPASLSYMPSTAPER